jgi:hypothetical protein
MESIFSIMAFHHPLYVTAFNNVVDSQTTPTMNSLNCMGIMVVLFGWCYGISVWFATMDPWSLSKFIPSLAGSILSAKC